ncbi:hypothetical protein B0F90DRAFT_1944658 [Multifurca ochricompacta]|uniref:Uncharacterized protein n=1 Tax=Multifurca ochricompacta TaxID=376703 RepID=A0AAD4MC00_9AGAM|nr:hypothetical protein B0F90DRAFT_1944658 [Multifurca ochricompacta]
MSFSQTQRLQTPLSSDTFKPSHDNLVDSNSTPFAPNSQHKSYVLDTSPSDPKGDFDDDDDGLNLRVAYPPPSQLPPPDRRTWWQKILPDSIACRLYVITVLVETTIDLVIEGDLLLRFHEADKIQSLQTDNIAIASRKMPVYLSVFALAHVFQLGMALDAVYARNTLQFFALTVFNALFLVYAIIQSSEVRKSLTTLSSSSGFSHIPVNVLTVVLPIVIAVAELAYVALAWTIYNEFGWKVYKFLGANRQIKKMFAVYQIYQCLVKFDVFFWVGFCVQFTWLVLDRHSWEFYITCAALPLSIILLVEGHLAARYENKWMMASFLSGCVGAMIYFSYKFIKVVVKKDTPEFAPVWESLTTFAVIAIILLLITFIYAWMVMRNFGRGLKDQISRNQASSGTNHRAYPSLSVRPNRMSID